MKINYNLYQVKPAIFLLEVESNEHLAMSFLRAQEFYESVNPDFQGKSFTMKEYSDWYKTQSKTGEFTYAEDWRGFNIPSKVIEDCYSVHPERTEYDNFLISVLKQCKEIAKEHGFSDCYMLGVRKGDTDTLEHEVAHGMYTVNQEYREIMTERVNLLPNVVKKYLGNWLTEKGYGESVHIDEIQAYLSTGLGKNMDKDLLSSFANEFELVFKYLVGVIELANPIYKGIDVTPIPVKNGF